MALALTEFLVFEFTEPILSPRLSLLRATALIVLNALPHRGRHRVHRDFIFFSDPPLNAFFMERNKLVGDHVQPLYKIKDRTNLLTDISGKLVA